MTKIKSFDEFNEYMKIKNQFFNYDINELIWKEYALKEFTNMELIELGLMDIIKKKIENNCVFVLDLYVNNIVKYDCYDLKNINPTFFDYITGYGHLDILKKLPNDDNINLITDAGLYLAAINGHLEVIKWLFVNRHEFHINNLEKMFDPDIIDHAACFGQLEVIKWLHYNYGEFITCDRAMNLSAMNCHNDIFKWLHNNRTDCKDKICNYYNTSIKFITMTGNIELLKWCFENRNIEYNSIFNSFSDIDYYLFTNFISSSNTDILEFFYNYKKEMFNSNLIRSIIYRSFSNGSLEKLKWVYEKFGEKEVDLLSWLKKYIGKKNIYYCAISSFNLEIIKLFFENIPNINYNSELVKKFNLEVISNINNHENNLEILKWFIENKKINISKKTLFSAIHTDNLNIFKYILKEYINQNNKKLTKKIKNNLLKIAISKNRIDVMKCIYYTFSDSFNKLYILDNKFINDIYNHFITNADLDTIEWLCDNIPTFKEFFKLNSQKFFKTGLEYLNIDIVKFYLLNGYVSFYNLDDLYTEEVYNKYMYNKSIILSEWLIANKNKYANKNELHLIPDTLTNEFLLKYFKNDYETEYDRYLIERKVILNINYIN
jgi:hypothetical protein